jgi:DNA-binding NarL/FixJ family response regulator
LAALSNGARGYLKEKAISSFLPKAVRQVEAGEAWVPRKMVGKIVDRLARYPGTMDR